MHIAFEKKVIFLHPVETSQVTNLKVGDGHLCSNNKKHKMKKCMSSPFKGLASRVYPDIKRNNQPKHVVHYLNFWCLKEHLLFVLTMTHNIFIAANLYALVVQCKVLVINVRLWI